MMMSNKDVADLLFFAADRIRFGGLAKDALEKDGAFCAVGAMSHRIPDYYWQYAPRAHAAVYRELGIDDRFGIVSWNNAPERTADEVIDVLTKAAKRLANGE